MILKKEHICTAATIIYHLTFLGGASFYVTEFQKTRDVIIQQVDRVEKQADKLKNTGNKIKTSINSFKAELKTVKNTCSKLRF